LYEAASIDGASKWQSFIHITLPGIRGVSQVIVVLHIIWTFVNFDVIYLLTKGGPLRMTEVVPTLLYREAFDFFNMGYAAAMGVFLLVVLAITVGRAYTKTSSFQ
jgi:ABC-type sugar transport system permease subunit